MTVRFRHVFWTFACVISAVSMSYSQQDADQIVQFSGRVLTESSGDTLVLIYTNIAVKGTPRGTVSRLDGFFSLPVRQGETLIFSNLGYQTVEYIVPQDTKGSIHSQDIMMKQDTLYLPEAKIYPWPDRDYFKIEFLALDISNPLEDLVNENLSPESIQLLIETLPADGTEVANLVFKQQVEANYYNGQLRPQNIFNPLSWKKFIEAIKRGDFKKKN